MSRPLVVLRPAPGNAATAARIEAAGLCALALPLFAVGPLAWTAPAPAAHDAVLLTSANAVRHAGAALARYADLPVYAVGATTAAAARAAGLTVVGTGTDGAERLAQDAVTAGVSRALHLAGRDRATAALPAVTRTVTVYASEPLPIADDALAELIGSVALIHSPRAGRRLAELVADRRAIRLAAISPAAAAAAGDDWAAVVVATAPTDAALIAAACLLARATPD